MNEASETAPHGGSGAGRERRSQRVLGRGYLLLFSALLLTGWVAAALVAVAPWTPLRAVAGLILVGIVPGALASYAALPPASRIDGRLRAVLVVSLSVAIALLLGLTLALLSNHVSRVAAAVGLAVVLTVAGVIAFARDDGKTTLFLPERPALAPVVAIVTGVLALAAIASVVAALNVDTLPTDFTALSLTRDGRGVRLSVSSHEDRATRFRYVLSDGTGIRLYSGAIRVDAGEEGTVLLPVSAGTGLVRAALFKPGSTAPYRSVDLRL